MAYILTTKELTKAFKGHLAVDHINLHVKQGDIYGFLGKNGAGKTTTIRMLMGLIKPTAGNIEMFGEKLSRNDKRHFERIGAMIETPGFYPNLSAYENLELHRRLMGMSDRKVTDESLEIVGLMDVKERKFGKLSLGMKQRLGIARALLHHPEILILDEPTNGLDPTGIKEIRQLILDLARERHITIMISSHILSEIQQLANQIGIIHKGKLLVELSLDDITEKNRHYMEFKVDNEQKSAFILEEVCGIRNYRITEPGCIRVYEQLKNSGRFNRELVQAGVEVKELSIQKETLEDYFLKLTGGESRE
ncbi:MAG TPA: ABC transporter ATP-binding protein [Bacillales bacterium]